MRFAEDHRSSTESPTKSAQFVGIILIKTLIKNINSQHPINYFYMSQGNDLDSILCFPCFWKTWAINQRST